MKKSFLGILSIFIFCLFFGSCTTVTTSGEPVVFNDMLPDGENAVIYFLGYGISIIGYNDIPVNWRSIFSAVEIRIPGGSTNFILNGEQGNVYRGFTYYRNVPFAYNFEKGKEYTFMINENMINIFNGKTMSSKDLLVSFNMRGGQTQIN